MRGIVIAALLGAFGCGGPDSSGPNSNPSGTPAGAGSGTDPGAGTGGGNEGGDPFTGTWSGTLNCEGQEETADGVVSGSFKEQMYATFDANGDLLLPGPNGEAQPQVQQGSVTQYVPQNGGQGSRTLVAFQKTDTSRRYDLRISENRTSYESGYSETYDSQTLRSDSYTLAGAELDARVDLDITVNHIISGPDVTGGHSRSRLVGACTGKLARQ